MTTLRLSRWAGFWYLLVAIFGSINLAFVNPRLLVPGDWVATMNNIQASEGLLRFGIFSNIILAVVFLCLGNTLYTLFRPVDKSLARLMVLFVVSSVPQMFLQVTRLAPLLMGSGDWAGTGWGSSQIQALGMGMLKLYDEGAYFAYIFYGLWMLPLGLLVFKSRSDWLTKVLGVALVVGCFGYIAQFLQVFWALPYQAVASLWMNVTVLAEVVCIGWLFVRGPADHPQAIVEKVESRPIATSQLLN
ncbi:MAG TPA: DUF4386 domain-containing protein [Anaerolineales bacterium]|nr:DUF4386 domain-containing protein [Anaerolineales bacterium]HRF46196.1 DUF4386 domain-containing protein [Anaerolineales bacterium]